jgi:transglutaminase-like putative cysteine protease
VSALLTWLESRLRPRQGWLLFILVLAAALCMPAALLGPGSQSADQRYLLTLSLLAVLAGIRLSRSRLSGRAFALVSGLLGALLAVASVARLWLPPGLLWRDAMNAIAWLRGTAGAQAPFSYLAGFFWQRLTAFGIRLWWWAQNTAGGVQDQDAIVLELLLALAVWLLSLRATWQIYRHQDAVAGLVPAGVFLTLVAFFRGGLSVLYFFVFLACSLSLVAAARFWATRARWEERDIDYPEGIEFDLALSLGPLLVSVLVLAAFLPVVTIHPLHDAFWRVMDEPWSRVEGQAERFFGPIDSSVPQPAGRPAGSGELPQAHLLGSGPELGEEVVMYVGTNDPPPPASGAPADPGGVPAQPRRYWRSATYDVYTGLGWTNSAAEPEAVPADRLLDADLPPGFDLVQQYRLLVPGTGAVLAANAPYRIDHAVQAWWRAPGDLLRLSGDLDQYSALSRVPEPSIAGLRASASLSATLPAGIASRYLALPEDVPERVVSLAGQVVAGAGTRYDGARRIELYLRTYTYNLDLPEPPAGRDLVDYFLFELQEGYCDYYASSMVVMARAVGVPARLATGYAQGTYDPANRRWVVTEQNGHSWVEVYFDGLGWIEFEPTGGLPALQRPGEAGEPNLSLPPQPAMPRRWWQRVPWPLAGLAILALGLVLFIAWLWRPHRAARRLDLVLDRYARLLHWGTRLGHPLRDGQTPHEYSASLGQAMARRGSGSPAGPIQRSGQEAPRLIEKVTGAFVQARYGSRPLDDRLQWRIRDLWPSLRRHLWMLWLWPRRRSRGKDHRQR